LSDSSLEALREEIDRGLPPTSADRCLSVAGLIIVPLGLAALLAFCLALLGYFTFSGPYKVALLHIALWTGAGTVLSRILVFAGGRLSHRRFLRRVQRAARTDLAHIPLERFADVVCMEVDEAHREAARARLIQELRGADEEGGGCA
jgi:hypothetical protein